MGVHIGSCMQVLATEYKECNISKSRDTITRDSIISALKAVNLTGFVNPYSTIALFQG